MSNNYFKDICDTNKLSKNIKYENKDECPVFAFQYVTTNKDYNINYFKKRVRDKCKAYSSMFHQIDIMEKTSWKELFNAGKNKGIESIDISQVKFRPNSLKKVSKDQKVLVVRFNREKYRMIGIKEKNVFQVIGFDFNYNAYNHG